MSNGTSGFDIGGNAKEQVALEDEGVVVHITNANGEPLYFGDKQPVTITVAGTYSKRYREAERAVTSRRFKGNRTPDIDAIRKEALNLTAECVLAWDGFFDGGKVLECSKANVVKVLDGFPWVLQQVEVAMGDHAGFSRAVSAS